MMVLTALVPPAPGLDWARWKAEIGSKAGARVIIA
jgi:hypothetical protein